MKSYTFTSDLDMTMNPAEGTLTFFEDGRIISCGEKEFSRVSSPKITKGLFGADEMITDHEPGADECHHRVDPAFTGGSGQLRAIFREHRGVALFTFLRGPGRPFGAIR